MVRTVFEKTRRNLYCQKELSYWRKRKDILIEPGREGYKKDTQLLGVDRLLIDELSVENNQYRILGEFDWDGLLLSRIGNLIDLPCISKEEFIPRTRRSLLLIDFDGILAIRKDYRGDSWAFVNEIKALHHLKQIDCNVPSILDVDFSLPALIISYIAGPTIKQEIVNQGVPILNRDLQLRYGANFRSTPIQTIVQEMVSCILRNVVDQQFISQLYAQIEKMHSSGFVWNDIKYGNIIIERESHKPFLIDFESSRYYPPFSRMLLRSLYQKDYAKLMKRFGDNFSENFNGMRH